MSDTLTIFRYASQLVTVNAKQSSEANPLAAIDDGALVVKNGVIAWLGKDTDLPDEFTSMADVNVVDVSGKILLPGLIDSHTHPVFAGNRAKEFEMRLQGKSYVDIAEAGGGIANTVRSTREASEDELFTLAQKRLDTMLSFGVTTLEAKSGYGLDQQSELNALRVIARLKKSQPQTIVATYMGAHDFPPDIKNDPEAQEAYVTRLCEQDIPEVAKLELADCCDVFCETGYFSVEQSRRVLETAKQLGLKLKIHSDEFNAIGGTELAGDVGALSADHLLHVTDRGMTALKENNVVATLLPGTAFYLDVSYAPARKLLDAGVTVALATDFNPGSCMTENLQWMMTLGCLKMKMMPAEAIQGVTINAAKALGLDADRGSLEVGKRGDITVFDVTSYQELLYHYGVNFLTDVFIEGQSVWSASAC